MTYPILEVAGGKLTERAVPMLNALNEVLRDDYIKDSMGGVARWNKVIEKHGVAFRLQVPHKAFNRRIGTLAGHRVTPDGQLVDEATWQAGVRQWLPTDEDRAYVASLMGRVDGARRATRTGSRRRSSASTVSHSTSSTSGSTEKHRLRAGRPWTHPSPPPSSSNT